MSGWRIRRAAAAVAVVATFVVTAAGTAVAPAWAVQTPQAGIVSDNPAGYTPNVLDGKVEAIAQVGSTMLIGGTFTQIQNVADGSPVLTRSGIASFDATTGLVSTTFAPTLDGEVTTILPTGDGTSVYVAGYFNTVNGVTTRKVTRLNITTGAAVTGFKAAIPNSNVQDMRLVRGQLIIAGGFTTVGGVTRGQLASLDPTTGKLTSFMQHTLAGPHNGGVLTVNKIDATPDGNRILALGNFSTVDGLDRDLLVLLNTSGATSVVSTWSTSFFVPGCSRSFDTYMRDLDISPDGTYAVVSTTGAYGGVTSPCDTQTRWDLTNENPNQQPVWRNVTGGDTTYAVAVTGSAVYVGGHFRWANNPYAGDAAGAGAVPREGIAALDPATGVPLSWNPGRERGVGVFDLLATSTGLWVGDDTALIGGEFHYRIAFFPLSGGLPMPANVVGTVPNDVYLLGSPTAGTDPSVLYRVNAAGPAIASVDDGPDWAADQTDPSAYRNTGSSIATYSPSATPDSSIPNTSTDRAPLALFDSERWDAAGGNEMQWHFPVPAGTHVTVRLYMANRCTCTQLANQRVFSVQIDGSTVSSNIDLAKTYGQNVAHMMAFTRTSDGSVDITFVHQVENPLVDGIEIINNDVTPGPGVGADVVRRGFFDGTAAVPTNTATVPSVETWGQSRGSFFVDGTLYSGWADGTLRARSFDGTTFGPSTSVALYGSTFVQDLPNITGIAYLNGRIYYTLANDNNLYWRWFTTQSQIVGSVRNTVANGSAMAPNRVAGMFASGTTLYFADKTDGHLYSAQLTGVGGGTESEGSVAGPATLVSSAIDWRARGDFVWNGTPALAQNVPPSASATASCSVNVCTFDGSGSVDPDGNIASYDWTFGDGSQHGSAATMSHAYTTGGTYTATLAVTDNRGATTTSTVQVNPASPPNLPPVASFSPVCTALACTFDAGTSFDPDGSVTSYAWSFGDGQTATGPTATHTFASAGTYSVQLTVTDDQSATGTSTQPMTVVDTAPASIGFRVDATASVSAANAKITVPASVQAGDVMVLFATSNSNNAVTTDPAGWTFVGERTSGTPDLRTRLYDKVATSTDAGSTVTVAYAASNKVDLQVAAYTGVDPTTPVSAFASSGETTSRTGHTTPGAAVSRNGSWVLSYWADKSASTTTWSVPGTVTVRGQSAGTGSGHLTSALADTGAGVAPGASAGLTATADAASAKATMWTVVLSPNGAPPPPNQPPVAAFTSSCNGLSCTFDGSGSTDPDGTIASYAWSFGDTGTASTATTGHTFAGQGTYTVSLTVTDNSGAPTTKTANLTVAPVASSHVAFRAVASAQANSATQKVTVPAAVQSGDVMLLFASSNNALAPTTVPAGWTLVGDQSSGAPDIRTLMYEKVAGGGDAGSQLSLTYAAVNKVDLVVAAYSGVDTSAPISAFASAGETTSRTAHTTPASTVANAGSWVVSYWADKSSATTTWTPPAGQTQRSLSVGTSSGRITSLLTDTNAVVPTGARTGLSATADSASAKATMWTVVLKVAP